MAKKYKMRLLLVGIGLFLSILVLFSYKKYQKVMEITSPLVVVENGLSINYLEGKRIKLSNEKKSITLSITNNSNEKKRYNIRLENLNLNQEVLKYDLTERNNKIKLLQSEISQDNDTLASRISIEPEESHFYTLTFYGTEDLQFLATLSVLLEEENDEFFATKILKNATLKKEMETKFGEETAETEEGLIEANTELGTIYYFRGKVKNNYVFFANLFWRIVKINADGSVKLILNDYSESSSNFYEVNEEQTLEDHLNFSKSKMYENLNKWYDENLKEYERNLISQKFCVDDSILDTEENKTYYLGNERILKEYNQEFNCLGKTFSSRIGLLTADEVLFAGASANQENTNFYLYLPDKLVSWWTLTPSFSVDKSVTFFEINKNGKLLSDTEGSYFRGVRPVINLVKKTIVTGAGTESDPYTIKE